jgi:hypothetical protein
MERLAEEQGAVGDESDCHFRKTGTEYDRKGRKSGIKRLSGTEK